ncbi:hypothetical protein [Lacinutrix chionoecetis]
MKNLKISIAVLALSGFAFTSCMDEKKSDKTEAEKMEMNSEMENNSDDKTRAMNNDTEEMMASNIRMTSKDGKIVERSMNNDVKAMQISGWESFNTLSVEMKKLEGMDMMKMKTAMPNFANTIATLNTTRPEWMMTEEISEDVEDLQKEYNELIADKTADTEEYRENLEEVNEAYDDLVEEINETFDKYVKINRKANEEYMEEAKDGEMEDAREEYNEEIKNLDKVANDKKK